MDFQDKQLTCKDCSKEFTWSAGEQKFYADKGLQNPPGRCQDCRKQMKDQKANRPKYQITCKDCGKQDEVNFEPRNPNDVLCSECFSKKRQSETGAKEEPVEKPE